jgi:hypothetical protein
MLLLRTCHIERSEMLRVTLFDKFSVITHAAQRHRVLEMTERDFDKT